MKRLGPNETIKPGTYFGGPEYKKQQILFRLDDNGELIQKGVKSFLFFL